MSLTLWIDPNDDDAVTLIDDSPEEDGKFTAIADKSLSGNDVVSVPLGELICDFEGADEATAYTSVDRFSQVFTFLNQAKLDDAQAKFGTTSLYLDGTGDTIHTPVLSSPITAEENWNNYGGDADFTIEGWFYWEAQVGNDSLWSTWAAGQRNMLLQYSGTTFQMNVYAPGSIQVLTAVSWTPSPLLGVWHHIAVCRSDGEIRIYANGELIGRDSTIGTGIFAETAEPFYIGSHSSTNYFQGWIDDFRVVIGTALYHADFDVPTNAAISGPLASYDTINQELRAVKFNNGQALVRANASPDLIDMDGPDFTVIVAHSRADLIGSPIGVNSLDGKLIRVAGDASPLDDAGWRLLAKRRTDFSSVRGSVGDETANFVDINREDVLICGFNGTDGDTAYTSEDESERVATFVDNAQLDDAQQRFGSTSANFDGTGDYISFPDSDDLSLGDGDFTIECWVRFDGTPGGATMTFMSKWQPSSQREWVLALIGNELSFTYSTTGADAPAISSAWVPLGSVWYHVAVSRVGDEAFLFVDGEDLAGAISFTDELFASTAVVWFGANSNSGVDNPFDGWIDDARIVKGQGLYTEDFVVPERPLVDLITPDRGISVVTLDQTRDVLMGHNNGRPVGADIFEGTLGFTHDLKIGENLDGGNIFEVIYADEALLTDERQRVEGYLAHKWNIVDELPDEHPFKTQGPDIVRASAFVSNFEGSDGAAGSPELLSEDSGARLITFVGTAQLDTAQFKYGASSLLLDGNSDYVTVPDDADLELGSADFAIECWVRFNGDPGTAQMAFVTKWTEAGNQRSWFAGLRNNELVFFHTTSGAGGIATLAETWNPVGEQWYHITFVREGTVMRVFVDGVQIGSDDATVASDIFADSTADVWIGAFDGAGDDFLDGWIDSVRITTEALYRYDFTPPHRGFVLPAPASLIANFNGPDVSPNTYISEDALAQEATFVSDAFLDSARKKFGVSSLRCDITADGVTFPDDDVYNFGAGDFTIEMWINFESISGNQMFIGQWLSPNLSWVWLIVSNLLRFDRSTNGTGQSTMISDSWTPDLDRWYHIAICRRGTVMEQYIDGVGQGTSSAIGSDVLHDSTADVEIGWYVAGSFGTDGWIDGLRITKGVALYDDDFTPPTDAPGEPII